MKRVLQSKVTEKCAFDITAAECDFEIIKREVQSKVTAECAFEIMQRILYTVLYRDRNIYIEIMKRVVQSKVTAECAFEIMKREVQSKVTASETEPPETETETETKVNNKSAHDPLHY